VPNQVKSKGISVVVVMSTYNGEKYLNEQLKSLAKQTMKPACVFVRDDGSTDNTAKLLEEWSQSTDKWLVWYQEKNLGPGRSFMEALAKAPSADYYAFCDQDDVWDSDKIACAVEALEKKEEPYKVYVSNVALANNDMQIYGQTHFRANNTLQAALMYNQAIGCTMVINDALRKKITAYTPDYMIMHDCWIYRVCAVLGGTMVFDNDYHMKYRQHEQNYSGGSKNKIEVWKKRINSLFGRKKHMRKNTALELLKGYASDMTEENRDIVGKFAEYDSSFKNKRRLIKDKEIYSESRFGNMGIRVSVLLGIL